MKTAAVTVVVSVMTEAPAPFAAPGAVGRTFPSVSGRSLAGGSVRLPEAFAGAPVVLLVAYRRGTQADIGRWIEMLGRDLPAVRFLEVPTIASTAWRPLAGWIDGGMRRGVPPAMWPNVVTVYRDGAVLREFLGDHGGLTAHVVLLDADGTVAWFNADGYGPEAAAGLRDAVERAAEAGRGAGR
jgi:hypothetical protein